MMKKILNLMIALSMSIASMAQCTPDPVVIAADQFGVWPAPDGGALMAEVSVPYSQVFTVISIADTTLPFVGTIQIDSFKVSAPNLPSGLLLECPNEVDCIWPGGASDCFTVMGTPTNADSTTLSIIVTLYLNNPPSPLPQTFDAPFDYSYVVTGVEDYLSLSQFDVAQNYPNPFSDKTLISFSSPLVKDYDFEVYNVLGERMHKQKLSAKQGLNQVEFFSENNASGMYIYTIKDENTTLTKRMIIE